MTGALVRISATRRSDTVAKAPLFKDAKLIEHLKKDADLDFLRPREDFKRWLAGLQTPR
jgi:hypothetical protein